VTTYFSVLHTVLPTLLKDLHIRPHRLLGLPRLHTLGHGWLALLMASVMKKLSMGLFRTPAAAAALPALASMASDVLPIEPHRGLSPHSPRAK